MLAHEADLPKYLEGTRRIDLDTPADGHPDGVLRGVPTSSGAVTGTARVVKSLGEIAREYGFPAVQLADAMRLIPDGATITVDGDPGTVTVPDDETRDSRLAT